MTEIHAALGLVNLKNYDDVLKDRKFKYQYYMSNLSKLPNLEFQKFNNHGETNYSYFPVIFNGEDELLNTEKTLNENGFFPRRYFYPSVNKFNNILETERCPLSESVAKRILCLPLYKNLKIKKIDEIVRLIVKSNY
mgnify:CR=1 FL=1